MTISQDPGGFVALTHSKGHPNCFVWGAESRRADCSDAMHANAGFLCWSYLVVSKYFNHVPIELHAGRCVMRAEFLISFQQHAWQADGS